MVHVLNKQCVCVRACVCVFIKWHWQGCNEKDVLTGAGRNLHDKTLLENSLKIFVKGFEVLSHLTQVFLWLFILLLFFVC